MQFINSGGMFNHYRAKSEGFFLNMHVKDWYFPFVSLRKDIFEVLWNRADTRSDCELFAGSI